MSTSPQLVFDFSKSRHADGKKLAFLKLDNHPDLQEFFK